MGYDTRCMISGFPDTSSCNDVLEEYFDELCQNIRRALPDWQPTRAVEEAFSLYTMDDEENRKDMVLIGPFDEQGNVRKAIPNDPLTAMPLIRALHDVVHVGTGPMFQSTLDQRIYSPHTEHPVLIFVNASALRILYLAAPHLTPARLWALNIITDGPSSLGPITGVEYGPVYAGGMYVNLRQMEDDVGVDDWMIEFVKGGIVNEEHRKEMMLGMGRQWVFVRPDRFPVDEAFLHHSQIPKLSGAPELPESNKGMSSLPVDVLLEIGSHLPLTGLLTFTSLSRSMFSALRPSIDSLVRSYIAKGEPWLLPPDDGGPEITAWDSLRREGEQLHKNTFSWLNYLKACRESASMKNRARLWGIANQLAGMADELDIPLSEPIPIYA